MTFHSEITHALLPHTSKVVWDSTTIMNSSNFTFPQIPYYLLLPYHHHHRPPHPRSSFPPPSLLARATIGAGNMADCFGQSAVAPLPSPPLPPPPLPSPPLPPPPLPPASRGAGVQQDSHALLPFVVPATRFGCAMHP